MNNENIPKRADRSIDSRKKIRVLIRFSNDNLFESFTYDISLTGVFVLARSSNILNKLSIGMSCKCFIEFNLENMIEAKGVIVRIQDEGPDERKGFALSLTELSEKNKLLLKQMIGKLE